MFDNMLGDALFGASAPYVLTPVTLTSCDKSFFSFNNGLRI